jgi:MFS superfamily sulfate permease-like transporter
MFLWKVHRLDSAVWAAAFFGTLFAGPEWGLGISIIVSLLIVIFESAYPQIAVLGRLPGTNQYRNVKQYPDGEQYDGIVMVRIGAPMYFANAQNIREKIERHYGKAQKELDTRGQKVKFIIVELGPVSHIDTGAIHTLSEMHSNYLKVFNIHLCLANPSPAVMRRLVISGLADEIGRDNIFVSIQDAVEHSLVKLDEQELSKPNTDTSDEPLKKPASELSVRDVEKGEQEVEEA